LVNNKVRDLTYRIHKPAIIDFFDYSSTYGHDMYVRSLYFLLCKAVDDVLPRSVKLHIKHSISGGKYCNITNTDQAIDEDLVARLYAQMRKLVDQNLPFERVGMLTADAIRSFQEHGLEDKYELFKNRDRIFTSVYKLGDIVNYYYGFMVPSTGYLKMFGLEKYESGILLKVPSSKNINVIPKTRQLPKLFSIYQQNKEWAEQMGVPKDTFLATVARYNELYQKQNDEDYGKRTALLTPIDKPPFYALKFGPSLLDVFGGVNTDVKLRVLDARDEPIPGLLAVGMVAGGLYGVDYPLLFNGNSHGRCLTWARQAAETIANGEA